jgi:hypothetical protein
MGTKDSAEGFVCETTTYFTDASRKEQNAEKVVQIVRDYARSRSIRHVIVASSWGRTAVKLAGAISDDLDGLNLVVVKLSRGWELACAIEFSQENRRFLEERGIPILTCTHSLTCAVPWALRKRYKGSVGTELIADVLHLFSQGMSTCVEISLMAADAGLVPDGKQALVIGGTNGWADTVVLLKVATTPFFFKTRILKILAKPVGGPEE